MDEAQKCVFQDGELQVIDDGLSDLFRMNQIRLTQDVEVGRHGRLGDLETITQFASAHWPLSQELKNPAAGRIGKGFEYLAHDATIS